MLSAICFNLEQSKILSSGNGLNSNEKQEVLYYFSAKGTITCDTDMLLGVKSNFTAVV